MAMITLDIISKETGYLTSKIVREYGQKIPLSQTADKHMAS